MKIENGGPLYAIGAFLLWGLSPIYFRAMASASSVEIVAHRIVWSVLFIAFLLTVFRRLAVIGQILTTPRLLLILLLTGSAVGLNWILFVWSSNNGYLLQSSLGYYINPLVNVVLGVLFLNERHGRWQWLAVAVATLGVLNMVFLAGQVPWISLGLACSFGAYGIIRKVIPVGALEGLFVETLIFAPIALAYLIWLGTDGSGQFTRAWPISALLMLSGIITAIPLMSFAAAVKKMRLGTLGFFQFITPTCHFVLGVFFFGETFTPAHLITFSLIWVAAGLYSWAGFRDHRRDGAAID